MIDLYNAFAALVGRRGQMTPGQYFLIATEIKAKAPARVLIFGAGLDSSLYTMANVNRGSIGRTVIVEDVPTWAARADHPPAEVIQVNYVTTVGAGMLADAPPIAGIPAALHDARFDVIVIDGPRGDRPAAPGRQQPIALAAQLIAQDGTIFVHDYNRRHERACCDRYFGAPTSVVGSPQLAIFTRKDSQ